MSGGEYQRYRQNGGRLSVSAWQRREREAKGSTAALLREIRARQGRELHETPASEFGHLRLVERDE